MEKLEANPPQKILQNPGLFFWFFWRLSSSIYIIKTFSNMRNFKKWNFVVPLKNLAKHSEGLLKLFEKITCFEEYFAKVSDRSLNYQRHFARFSQRELKKRRQTLRGLSKCLWIQDSFGSESELKNAAKHSEGSLNVSRFKTPLGIKVN